MELETVFNFTFGCASSPHRLHRESVHYLVNSAAQHYGNHQHICFLVSHSSCLESDVIFYIAQVTAHGISAYFNVGHFKKYDFCSSLFVDDILSIDKFF